MEKHNPKLGDAVLYNFQVVGKDKNATLVQRPAFIVGLYENDVADIQVLANPSQDRDVLQLPLNERNPLVFIAKVEYSPEAKHNKWTQKYAA